MEVGAAGAQASTQQSTSFSPFEQLNTAQTRGRGQDASQAQFGPNQAPAGQSAQATPGVEPAGASNTGVQASPGGERGQLLDIEV